MSRRGVHRLRARAARVGPRTIASRAALLAATWWLLTSGDLAALAFGAPAVLLALAASLLTPPARPVRPNPWHLARLAGTFLWGSLHGGVDVARRALARPLALSPAFVRYPLRLRRGPARNLFMTLLSLMPGTLSVTPHEGALDVHVLFDDAYAVSRQLAALENEVARALGQPLEA